MTIITALIFAILFVVAGSVLLRSFRDIWVTAIDAAHEIQPARKMSQRMFVAR